MGNSGKQFVLGGQWGGSFRSLLGYQVEWTLTDLPLILEPRAHEENRKMPVAIGWGPVHTEKLCNLLEQELGAVWKSEHHGLSKAGE